MGVECNEHRNMIIIQGESISVQNVVASIQIYVSSVCFCFVFYIASEISWNHQSSCKSVKIGIRVRYGSELTIRFRFNGWKIEQVIVSLTIILRDCS